MSNKKVMSLTEIENIERRLYANYAREACVKKQKAPRKVKTVARETSFTVLTKRQRQKVAAKRRDQAARQTRDEHGRFIAIGLFPLPPFRPYSWRNY